MRAGLVIRIRIAAACRGVTVARMSTSRGITPLADIRDGKSRGGRPELVIRGENPVIPVPVLPRRGTRSASRSKKSHGESSTTPLASGRVDFRPRPELTQLAASPRRGSDA